MSTCFHNTGRADGRSVVKRRSNEGEGAEKQAQAARRDAVGGFLLYASSVCDFKWFIRLE